MILKLAATENTGKQAENIAATYLAKQGVKLLEQNFHCRFGEIDLIAVDEHYLLFVEVRYRKNENYMAVVETITQRKCRKIITTSNYFLNKHRDYQSYQYRYDVMAITGEFDKPAIEWIKNAFQA